MLKVIGFWNNGRFLKTLLPAKFKVETCSYKDILQIKGYLLSPNNWLENLLLVGNCHICGKAMEESGLVLTDGDFAWPANIFHHVSAHGYRLPPAFLKKIRGNNYVNKASERQLRRSRCLWVFCGYRFRFRYILSELRPIPPRLNDS